MSDVFVCPEDFCGTGKLLKFKELVSQLLCVHILLPHEFRTKSRPDSKDAPWLSEVNNRLIVTSRSIVPGLLKYSTKEIGYEGNFLNLSAPSHIFSTYDGNL
jgi:hypothetical protein